jgi:hypothetical protein
MTLHTQFDHNCKTADDIAALFDGVNKVIKPQDDALKALAAELSRAVDVAMKAA